MRAWRDFVSGQLSVRVEPKSADETGLTALARGLAPPDPDNAPVCYIFGVRQGVQTRVLTHTLLLLTLVGAAGCLPSDHAQPATELEVSHEKYPEFEAFSDTQSAVLTGSGGSADWLDEATYHPGLDSTGDRFSSGQGSFETGSGSQQDPQDSESESEGGEDETQETEGTGETESDDSSADSTGEDSSNETSGSETWTSTEPVKP